jgi:replicative DNA helicase
MKELLSDVEATILSMFLHNPRTLEQALNAGLTVEHFKDPRHSVIFLEMLRADEQRLNFDLTSLALRLQPDLTAYLVDLAELSTGGLSPSYLTDRVMTQALRRNAVEKLSELSGWIKNAGEGVDSPQIRSKLSEAIESLAVEQSVKVESLADAADVFFERVDQRYQDKFSGSASAFGVSTGLETLDLYLQGFRPGALYIIGGRPGTGKSELCCNLAYNIAEQGHGVVYFSFEMTSEEIAGRIVSRLSRVSDSRLLAALATDEELDQLAASLKGISEKPLYLIDNIKPQWEMIKQRIRSMVRTHKIKVAIIDYIQQLSAAGFRPSDRVRELSLISTEAKQLAKELNISVICAAQLNRQSNDRDENHPPQSRHLKESGSLEQDANVVLLIHRKQQGYDLFISKNRHGQEGAIPVRADFEFHTFSEGR